MAIAGIIITANPILGWESFVMSLDRAQITGPRVEHRDMGGFYKFSFNLHSDYTDRILTSDFLVNGAMRHVEVYNDKGMVDWEGCIGKIEENTGTTKSETDINNVFNRQWCRYNDAGIQRSTVFNDADSQARIGIKERAIIGGEVSLGVADQYIEGLMGWTSFPAPYTRQIDFTQNVAASPGLELVCYGYWHTLFRRTYNQTIASGDAAASAIVDAIITDVGEFVSSTEIEDNISQIEQEADTDRMAGEIITSICAVGDGGLNKWIAGFEANNKFYYRQARKPVR